MTLGGTTASYLAELSRRKSLSKISKANRSLIRWVKDHSGILDNCRANDFANRATMKTFYDPEPLVSVAMTLAKCSLAEFTVKIIFP